MGLTVVLCHFLPNAVGAAGPCCQPRPMPADRALPLAAIQVRAGTSFSTAETRHCLLEARGKTGRNPGKQTLSVSGESQDLNHSLNGQFISHVKYLNHHKEYRQGRQVHAGFLTQQNNPNCATPPRRQLRSYFLLLLLLFSLLWHLSLTEIIRHYSLKKLGYGNRSLFIGSY